MDKQISRRKQVIGFLADNVVTVIFVVFVLIGFMITKEITFNYFIDQLFESVFRNAFLVLSLIIPVIAGLGMNFGIVVGAISAQMALVAVRYFDVPGLWSLLVCVVLALPLAMLFGWLTGKLYNKTRGQEMIAGLIVGYFADGVYQFFMLFVIGAIIPVNILSAHIAKIINPSGIGIRMTVDMGGFKYSLDGLWRMPFMTFTLIAAACFLAWLIIQHIRKGKNPALGKQNRLLTGIYAAVCLFLIGISAFAMATHSPLMKLRQVPVVTVLVILLLCLFTHFIIKTKLGQDFRSVGQSQQIARVSGINVDKTRIIAVVMSTVLASWGMLIYLQNMGTLNVYNAHTQIGLFSVASLLVGGASTSKASVKNALIGVVLFNAMFIMSPAIALTLFGDNALYAEYIRTFMVYGVIGLALGLYVWRGVKAARQKVE